MVATLVSHLVKQGGLLSGRHRRYHFPPRPVEEDPRQTQLQLRDSAQPRGHGYSSKAKAAPRSLQEVEGHLFRATLAALECGSVDYQIIQVDQEALHEFD